MHEKIRKRVKYSEFSTIAKNENVENVENFSQKRRIGKEIPVYTGLKHEAFMKSKSELKIPIKEFKGINSS